MSAPTGERHGHAKLDTAKVKHIRSEYLPYARGYGHFAKLYGVRWESIRDVVSYRTWRHVR